MDNPKFSSIIFDFDSTLTAIEGVDYLAELHDVGDQVASITAQAMNTHSITSEMYNKRLQLINPHREDLTKLSRAYQEHLVPGVKEVVESLQSLDKSLYIVSGGIRKAIVPVGAYLNIPPENIHAVDVYFNMDGDYTGFDQDSALVQPDGKNRILRNIAPNKPMAFIGDGANDVTTKEIVERFIGFGGVHHRPPVAKASDFYVEDPDLKAVLPLILTPEELESLDTQGQK